MKWQTNANNNNSEPQEVEELEAQVALFGERQVLECRLSAVCEAQVVEAQMEAGNDSEGKFGDDSY